jgi:adenylate cyclase
MTASRRLAAILAADIAGYSRLMGADEEGTLERLMALRRELLDPKIAEHRGRIVKTTGDGLLVEFASVVDAVRCAVEVQQAMAERSSGVEADNRIELRIGINLGDVIVEGDDLYGDGVNIAARIEALADPGGMFVSNTVYDHVRDRLPFVFEDLGEQQVKNIARPVRVYRVRPEGPHPNPPPLAGEGSALGARLGATEPPLPLPDKPSIAVLPFANMSGDPEQEYFAGGIGEDVITLLSKSRGLFVIARNSTFTYKGQAVDVKQVGRELGVRYVLEGSVRKVGNRVRVAVQLIEVATGGHLWAERYDRDLTDIFAVQDEITMSVSTAILPTVERNERERAARKPPDSLDAWECYHRGLWHFSKIEPAENTRAISFFERAIELDPSFAAAHSALSYALGVQATLFSQQSRRQTLFPCVVEHARRAIALDPTDALGRCSLSYVLLFTGRHNEAMAEADLAVSLDPNSVQAYHCQGGARTFGGRPREAVAPLETAIRLSPSDPFTPFCLHTLGRAYYYGGDYPAAVATSRLLCRSYSNFQPAYRTLIAALGQTGEKGEARRVMAEALDRFGADFRSYMGPLGPSPTEDRAEDREHLLEGYRKAGVLER